MISLKKNNKGFTIIELLIVIIIIGILALIGVVAYGNVQESARDSKRQSDVSSIHTALEAYFVQEGVYPAFADLDDSTWRSTNLRGVPDETFQDPKAADDSLATAATVNQYAYAVTPANCDNAVGTECTAYTLTATLEAGGTAEKTSLN